MGTRADFYVGRGEDAEWLGSVAWDGQPDGFDTPFYLADSESQYRGAIAKVAEERDDWIAPERGWPWPWETSATSDYAYAFDDGKVYATYSDHWWPIKPDDSYMGDPVGAVEDEIAYGEPGYDDAVVKAQAGLQATTFPNMKARQMAVADMMNASGMIVVSVQP